MRQLITAIVSGSLFALGLLVSGLANPTKVLAFLDIAGQWDPSLALVMGGAIAVAIVPYQVALRRAQKPFFATKFDVPTRNDITKNLIFGAVLFGIGWGVVGYCPGPALVNAFTGQPIALLFIIAMIVGMRLARKLPFSR